MVFPQWSPKFITNGKEQAGQKEIQNVQFEEKRRTRKCNRAKFCAETEK